MDFDEVDALNLYHWLRMKRFGPCKFISREGVVFYHTTGDTVLRVSNSSIDYRAIGARLGAAVNPHPIIEYDHGLLEDMLNHKFKFQEKKDQIF